MEKINKLFNSIENGNHKAINDFIVASRQYVLNTARSIVNDDDKAIEIAEKVYERIIFNKNSIDKDENVSKYLYSIIKDVANEYLPVDIELKEIPKINSDINVFEIDDSVYADYYNNPKVERVIYETINALPKEEKEIVIKYYFGQESIKEIADDYAVNENVINNYISKANDLIEKKSKPLFVKYKVETADYSNVAIIYSVVKKCISIATFDIVGIAADKIKDKVTKDVEEDEKDLKSFVKDILEDLIQDWFIDRIKSVFAISSIGVTSKTIADTTTGVAKKAGMSLAKKVVLGVVAAGVATTGGVVAYNAIESKNNVKVVESIKPAVSASMDISSVPVMIDFYSSQNDEIVDKICAEFMVSNKTLNESKLKAIEISAAALSIDISHSVGDTMTTIRVIADKQSIGKRIIDFASTLGIIEQSKLEQLNKLISCDVSELISYLNEIGVSVVIPS